MEDLAAVAVLGSAPLGNQCWGPVELPEGVERDPATILAAVFGQAARLHAAYWRSGALLRRDMAWLKASDWLQGRGRARWHIAMGSMGRMWRRVTAAVAAGKLGVALEPAVVAAMDGALAHTTWDGYRAAFDVSPRARTRAPFTLVHGDFHAANMMWVRAGASNAAGSARPPLYFLDWPEVGIGCPFTEIAQFMVSNATIEVRRAHEKALLRRYQEQLVALLGVGDGGGAAAAAGCDWDTAWLRYRAGGIERWLQMLAILAVIHLDNPAGLPEFGVRWFHGQVAAFVEDHYADVVAELAAKGLPPLALQSVYCLPF
jgi:hypothetical protein